jgi:hypothetical protein
MSRNLDEKAGDTPVGTYMKNVLFEGERFAKSSADRPLRANDHETSESEEFSLGA